MNDRDISKLWLSKERKSENDKLIFKNVIITFIIIIIIIYLGLFLF